MKKIILLLLFLAYAGNAFSQGVQITDRLRKKMQSINPMEYTRVLILLKDRVDIESLDAELYRINAPIDYRAETVINTLKQKAALTQGPLIEYLNSKKKEGTVKEFIDFWITNIIYAEATSEVLNELSRRNEIEIMDIDEKIFMDLPVYVNDSPVGNSTESAETGLRVIKADLLWRLGITGAGRTVMHIDTGADALHPALGPRWWGNNGRPWYHAWYDPVAPFTTSPTDCGSHGTHTMGIMCGRNSATGDTVGVAPDAMWMSAGITDCPGASYPSMNIAAYQWAMDPDSNSATMDMPDAISCSWQDPTIGGITQCTSIYVTTLNAVEAAGIAVVFSAGNSGPAVSSITPPKNINTDSVNVFCVGAVDANTTGTPIASFSSRGPSICGGSGTLLIKPEVSAPGVNVRSTIPGNSYTTMSGTSMASPHVAGCIALLKQVAPNLTGKQLKAILFSTCTDLGTPGEDNDYGKGLINVYAAFQMLGAFPLNNFSLLSPSAGTILVGFPNSTTNVTITWDTSATGAQYKWIFGSPTTSPRKLTIPSSTNSINITLGQLDNLLAGIGLNPGDSLTGQWDVWSFRVSSTDSLKSSNGPRALTLKRGVTALSPFSLNSPPTGTSIITSPVDNSNITINWRSSGLGLSYKWMYKTGVTYSDPATLRLPSNGSGFDTVLTIRNSQMDSIIGASGVNPGDSITGQWRVRSYTGTDSLNSAAPDRTITFRRATLLALNQDFTDAAFPPFSWGLDNGGGSTQYWTRNAAGGYAVGTGSAKYDFWTAGTTTPLQTLTSNQFPAVTSPVNYLRFNYSQAFYLSGTTLAPDSCIIETSVNNGSTWTTLLRMGSSQTISSGYNSNGIMTTVGGPFMGAFTPSAAGQWATKILLMPLGTNKVRFVAKSGFGNNLYIDNITSGTITGIGSEPLTFIPEKYDLHQNYPNPFNPSTKISFDLPVSKIVTLKIYDVLGKEVATLVNEMKNAGSYEVEFNATNLASGAYFYKMEAGEFRAIKRMIVIK